LCGFAAVRPSQVEFENEDAGKVEGEVLRSVRNPYLNDEKSSESLNFNPSIDEEDYYRFIDAGEFSFKALASRLGTRE
jgi:hypothetical protein